ncbi:MAG: hypothetical protein R3309_07490 [Reinekea sp.]|nr:hypothetical protein [Reinekea sp.]MDX1473997.1 hypothetical protein [Reinekea sp.]
MPLVEIYGYAGSVLIALSLMMSNIIPLRWINLVGAAIFSTYGLVIHAWPVAVLNGFIVLIDIYHLWHIYRTPKAVRKTRLKANNPYVTDILALQWPQLKQISEQSQVEVTFHGNEPKDFQVLAS